MVLYKVFLLIDERDDFVEEVQTTILDELEGLGLVNEAAEELDALDWQSGLARVWRVPEQKGIWKLTTDDPAACIVLSPDDEPGPALKTAAKAALDEGHLVIPVARTRDGWRDSLPEFLHDHNVGFWDEPDERKRILRTVLDEIGFGERDRRVFISYRRDDGSAMAWQLYRELSTMGFDVFLDQADVRRGEIVQEKIYEAIDDKGFLLVLESPTAHESPWIEAEITASMRLDDLPFLLLTWPDTNKRIATAPPGNELRHRLSTEDLTGPSDDRVLTDDAMESVLDRIYLEHSRAIGTRRRSMLQNVVDAAATQQWHATLVGRGAVVLTSDDGGGALDSLLVGVSSRTPRPISHFRLDTRVLPNHLRTPGQKFLVHTAHAIDEELRRLNAWATETRNLEELHIQEFLTGGHL